MSLRVDGTARRGAFTLTLAFESAARVTLLRGPSGAGKTMSLHMIAGLIPGARVTLDGAQLGGLTPEKRGIAMAFQEPRLFPHLGVRANILYSGGAAKDLPALAERLDIAGLLNRRPADLSGGQAQRVSLARALLPRRRLVLLDEPFTGLDAARREAVAALIAEQPGRIVMVSHDPADADRFAAHVVPVAGSRAP